MLTRSLLFALLLAGCAHAPAAPDAAPICPAVELAVPADTVLPRGHGTARAPLEWGRGAVGDRQLWLGRLACSDGAVPTVQRLHEADDRVRSRAPRSDVWLSPDAEESLSVWSVRCPGQPEQQWVANPYRCGVLAPPAGFQLLPVEASIAVDATRAALQAREEGLALSLADAAVSSAPEFEVTHLTRAAARMALGDPGSALASFEDAAAIHPDNIAGLYARVVLLRAAGELEAAQPLAFRLLEVTPSRHPQRPSALCLAALSHQERGEAAEALTLAGRACAQGFSACCALGTD